MINVSNISITANFGDCRIIRKSGAVVAFDPGKISLAVTKAFLAACTPSKTRTHRASFYSKVTKQLAAVAVTEQPAGDGDQAADDGGSSGGGSDDGGDGDGDGDGPRRRRTITKSLPPKSYRSPSARPSQSHRNLDAAHRRALITLVLLTSLVLAAALTLALTGHSWLASEAMGMAMGLPKLTKSLVKPK